MIVSLQRIPSETRNQEPVTIVTDLGDQKVTTWRLSEGDQEGGVDHGGGEGGEAEGAAGHRSSPALWTLG